MQRIPDLILSSGLSEEIITDDMLRNMLPGRTHASKWGLVNRALQRGELLRLRRGMYVLSPELSICLPDLFYIANRLKYGSFVSFESALSYHAWIPEKPEVVQSANTSGRSATYENTFSEFIYTSIPSRKYHTLDGVGRYYRGKHPVMVATPLRAIADRVFSGNEEWRGLSLLTDGFRIDPAQLSSITAADFDEIAGVYRSYRVLEFLADFRNALGR